MLLLLWPRRRASAAVSTAAAIRRVVMAGIQRRMLARINSSGAVQEGLVTLTLIEGTTAKRRLQLQNDGAAPDSTGLSAPSLVLKDRDGRNVSVSGVTAWTTITSSTFDVTLGSLHLKAARAPYEARFILTLADGTTAPYPDTEKGDIWRVVKQ